MDNQKRLLGVVNLELQSQKLLRLKLVPAWMNLLSDLISRFLSPAGLVRRRNPAAFTQTLPFKLSGNKNGFGDAKSLSVAPISKFLLLVKKEGEVLKPTPDWFEAFASTSPFNLFLVFILGFIFSPFYFYGKYNIL